MLAAPAPRGPLRGREPVHARRPARRQPAGARRARGDDGAARHVRVARARLDRAERAQAAAGVRRLGRRGALRAARRRGSRTRRPASAARCSIGAIKPWECKRVRHGVHAGAADRDVHGLERGRLRRLLQLRATGAARTRPGVRQRRPKLRDELVTLAHGAGGKATRALVEGLFLEELGNPLLDAARRRRAARARTARGSRSRPTRTSSSRSSSPAATSASSPSTARSTTSRSRARGRSRSRPGFVIEEGFPVADLRRIAASMARAAEAAGVPVATGDTKVVERGKADGLYVTTAGDRRSSPTASARPGAGPAGRPRARLRHARRPRHGGAWSPAASSSSRSTCESDTAPVHELAAALLELGDAAALAARPDPRRPRDRAQRARAAGRARRRARRGGAAAAPGGRRRVRDPRHRSALRRERGQAGRGRRRGGARTRRSRCCERTRSAPSAAIVGEVARGARGHGAAGDRASAAAASSTCSSATRCRESANGSTESLRDRAGRGACLISIMRLPLGQVPSFRCA